MIRRNRIHITESKKIDTEKEKRLLANKGFQRRNDRMGKARERDERVYTQQIYSSPPNTTAPEPST